MQVTVSSFTFPADNVANGDYVLRFWYLQSFIDSTNQFVASGSATTGAYFTFDATASGGTVTVDPMTIYSTVDALVPFPQSIQCACQLFRRNSALPITPFLQNGTSSQWVVPSSLGASFSFAQWATYNQAAVLTNPPSDLFYTRTETDQAIEQALDNAALNQDVVIGDYASFAAAVSAIGSTATTLVINQATSVTANTTVPSTLTLKFTRKGSITISNSVTLTVVGPIEADPVQIFFNALSGQGTVSFSGNTLTSFQPEWWGADPTGVADSITHLTACLAAIDTAGGGTLEWGDSTYKTTTSLIVAAASGQHYINIHAEGPVRSILNYAGSTSSQALILNSEKYTKVEGLRVVNTVAKGTTEGIRLYGTAGTGTQTTGAVLERVIVVGFATGLRASNGASSTSSEIAYQSFTAQSCDTGILIDDANAITHKFSLLGIALNTIGLQLDAGSVFIDGGSGSFNGTDFKTTAGQNFDLHAMYTESTTGKALDLTGADATKFTIIGGMLGNGASTPNAHTMVSHSGGKLSMIGVNIGGQVVFVQGNANSFIGMEGCTIIDLNNTYTSIANPDLMAPGFRLTLNAGGLGTFKSIGNTQCNGDFNTIVGQFPSGTGYIAAGATGQGIAVMYDNHRGSAVASATAIIPVGPTFHVTGTTSITSITGTGLPPGSVITLIFDDVLTFTDGSNLVLAGNFVTTAGDSITLRWDGTNFYEMSRSVN